MKRIAFDLDGTLIPTYNGEFPCEPPPPWFFRFVTRAEPMRLGSVQLMAELAREGWEMFIYTSSFRSPLYIRAWLFLYGIRGIRGVINQKRHDAAQRRSPQLRRLCKDGSLFGISVLVDDRPVAEDGANLGFQVVVIDPSDHDWVKKVLKAAAEWK